MSRRRHRPGSRKGGNCRNNPSANTYNVLNDVTAEDVVSAAEFFANQGIDSDVPAPVAELCLV